MNITAPEHPIHSIEFEGFFYVESDGHFYKGCRRCGGTGHYSFNGYDSICYLCNNHRAMRLGDEFATREAAEKWCHGRAVAAAKRQADREAKRLAKLAARDAAWQALKDQAPDVWELLRTVANCDIPFNDGMGNSQVKENDQFILKMADMLWNLDERPLSTRQIEVVQDKLAKRVAKQAEAAETPAPAGRVVVTGEIVSAKTRETEFGTQYKILVKDDQGFKVWVSIPKAQADQAYDEFQIAHPDPYMYGYAVWFEGTTLNDDLNGVKGRRITFTATLEPSKDDVAFAFGSRPTKGAWL